MSTTTLNNAKPEPVVLPVDLRDYFAAKAMQGIIAASGDKNGTVDFDDEAVAKNAYAMANDMLKARKGGV